MEEFKSRKRKVVLPIALTSLRMGSLGLQFSKLRAEMKKREAEFFGIKKAHEIRKAELEEDIDKLCTTFDQGYEEQEVECEEVINFGTGVVKYLDLKNRKIIYERPITEDEKQLDINFDTYVPEPVKEKPVTKICVKCDTKWFGTGRLCWNCKKLEDYRFAREA